MRQLLRQLAILGTALLVALAMALVGAVAPALVPALVGGLAAVLVEAVLHLKLAAALPRQADQMMGLLAGQIVRAALHLRLLLGQLLVLAYVLRASELSQSAERVVVLGVVVAELLRTALLGLQLADGRLRLLRAELRGLPLDMPSVPPRPALLGEPGVVTVVLAGGLVPFALLWRLATGSSALVAPAAVVSALICAAVLAAVAPSLLRLTRLPRGGALLRQVHQAVAGHAPEILLYSAGGRDDIHWLTPWLDVLANLGRPALVMLRQRGVTELVPATPVPVLCLPEARDVLLFSLPSAQVVLYVGNSAENVRLLRNPRLRSAFIGHGDSDKSSSANPSNKMYDEVWVAGPAGRQRYLDAGVGVLQERIRLIGRPQVARIDTMPPGGMPWPCTVLYAPTWEGLASDPYESSVLHTGRDVVRVLLALEGVRVIFRPHPATGRHNADAARAVRDISQMIEQAGPQHETVAGGGVDPIVLFNRSDALVADVSGIVTDFLASEKPYFVVDGRGLPEDEYRRTNPSTSAACLIGAGASGLEQGLRDAAGSDSLRPARQALREHLLGPRTPDPQQGFRDAVDALAAQSLSRP